MGSIINTLSGGGQTQLQNPDQLNFGQMMMSRSQDAGPQSQFRDQQMALNQQLMDRANGVGPSIAQQQLQAGTDQTIAAQQAAAASARGMSPGMAMRIAAQNGAQAQQQMAQQSGLLRLQEQQGAQGLLNQGINQGRTGDLQSQQLRDQTMLGFGGLQNQRDLGSSNLEEESNKRKGDFLSGLLGKAGQGAASAAMMSDERAKTDIKDGSKKVASFLDALKAHDYKYKDPSLPGAKEGRAVSVMAQELEKSELGRSMVKDTPVGKIVDYGRGFGAMLAAQASLNERLKKVEGKKNG